MTNVNDDPFADDVADKVEQATGEPEQATAEPEQATAEPEQATAEPEQATAEPEQAHQKNIDELFASGGSNKLLAEIFNDTKINFSLDDPIIVALLANHRFINQTKELFKRDLKIHSKQITADIDKSLNNGIKVFDERYIALQKTLDELSKQKEHLIAEVYARSKANIQDTLSKELMNQVKILMKTTTNSNNNVKYMLLGGVGGCLVAFILFMLLTLVLR